MERARGQERYAQDRDEEVEVVCERYETATETWVPWDLSDPSLSVRLRGYLRASANGPITATVCDVAASKVSGGTTGHARGHLRFSDVYPSVECEAVVVDTSSVNDATLTGYRETQVRVWDARVERAVVAA